MNRMKKIVCSSLIGAALMVGFTVNAYATIVDNDPLSGQGTMTQGGYTYMKASGSYNGDARVANSSAANNYYIWGLPAVKSGTLIMSVYLNHYKFTATNTSYGAYFDDGGLAPVGIPIRIGFNQNSAPGGWSQFPSVYLRMGGINSIELRNDGQSGITGADAIKY